MKHNYHERKEARIDYAIEKSGKNKNPIDSAMLHPVESDKKTDYYANKARSIEENNAISSDDPDALEKLEQKLNVLEKHQEFMKTANRFIKKNNKEAFLKLEGATQQLWLELTTPDFVNRTGYPSYQLTNNNANIRRIKERLKILNEVSNKTTNEKTIKGIKVIENVEANRIQLIFPDVPSKEVRERLKKEFRFIWCPSENAWQRFLNKQGIWAAEKFMETYQEDNSSAGTSNRAA